MLLIGLRFILEAIYQCVIRLILETLLLSVYKIELFMTIVLKIDLQSNVINQTQHLLVAYI